MKILEIAGACASVSSLLVALYFQWQGAPELRRNVAMITGFTFIALTGLAYLRDRHFHRRTASLSDKITIPDYPNREYEIFYRKAFKRRPFLELRCISSIKLDFHITEQRADGFKFKTGRILIPSSPRWILFGEDPPVRERTNESPDRIKLRFIAKGEWL